MINIRQAAGVIARLMTRDESERGRPAVRVRTLAEGYRGEQVGVIPPPVPVPW
jgi:hypothetical protein